MSKKRSLETEDISELYEKLWEQIQEDRKDIKEVYDELRESMRDKPHRFVELGDTLAKLADLRIKQTAQVLDIVKEATKAQGNSKGDEFTSEDFDSIRNAIEDRYEKDDD